MKKIGLLGGTFDPVHLGHLNLAFELMEKGFLDEVWFVPAHISPHKTHRPPVSFEHRLKMLELAIENIPQFKIKDVERHRPPPSYTIDTLRLLLVEIAASNPSQFYLLLGEDSIAGFCQWHLPHEIIQLVHLLIGSRSGNYYVEKDEIDDKGIEEAIHKGVIKTRLMDISSSDIRMRLQENLYCAHLVPTKVIDYICKNNLYTKNHI